jgi:cell wall-associated NlpC family hydrolase
VTDTITLPPGAAINRQRLMLAFHAMVGRVLYAWGAKEDDLTTWPAFVERLDCSGFVRFIVAWASGQRIIMPDGSAQQHTWCNAAALHQLDSYHDLSYTVDDPDRLFIAFIPPTGSHPGHVWLVRAGSTMECRSRAGVSSRAWNAPVLRRGAVAVYELPAYD